MIRRFDVGSRGQPAVGRGAKDALWRQIMDRGSSSTARPAVERGAEGYGDGMYHVGEFLGHESLDTIKHYAKLTITDLKETHRKCHPRERDQSE